jgi:predicted nucleotide-binding protein
MYRDVKFVLLDQLLKDRNIRLHLSELISNANPRRVFLVHGRNHKLRDKVHRLLTEGFGLEVVGWEDARDRVKTTRPYIYEIVMAGIELSHLTLVLFSDDEQVVLKNKFKSGSEKADKRERRQARANVFIEAGYAMGVRPRRTLFLEWPENTRVEFETPSDFSGIHSIRFDESASKRDVLRRRLESARCLLTVNTKWDTMPL